MSLIRRTLLTTTCFTSSGQLAPGRSGRPHSPSASLPPLTGKGDLKTVRCRICERSVVSSVLEAHTADCLARVELAKKIKALDRDLKRLAADVSSLAGATAPPPGAVGGPDDEDAAGFEIVSEADVFESHVASAAAVDPLSPACVSSLESLFAEVKVWSKRALGSPSGLGSSVDAVLKEKRANLLKAISKKHALCREYQLMSPLDVVDETDPRYFLRAPPAALPVSPKSGLEPPSMKDFDVVKPIAKGGFGKVYLARKKATGDMYALKVLRKSEIGESQVKNIMREKNIMAAAHNDFVVRLYYAFQTDNHLYFVMEYLPGGDCFSLLNVMGRFEEDFARFYLAELVAAVDFLHSKGTVHRDLKPDNLMIGADGHVKVTDFGLSNSSIYSSNDTNQTFLARSVAASAAGSALPSLTATPALTSPAAAPSASGPSKASARPTAPPVSNPSGISRLFRKKAEPGLADLPGRKDNPDKGAAREMSRLALNSMVGTPNYAAPEILRGKAYNHMVDWWSVGCIGFEFLTGYPPFWDESDPQVYQNILSHRIPWPSVPLQMSAEAHDLLNRLLDPNPGRRLGSKAGAADIKAHPFFATIDWSALKARQPPFVPALGTTTDTKYFAGEPVMEDSISKSGVLADAMLRDLAAARNGTGPAPVFGSASGSPEIAFSQFGHVDVTNLVVLNKEIIDQLRSDPDGGT